MFLPPAFDKGSDAAGCLWCLVPVTVSGMHDLDEYMLPIGSNLKS